MELYAESIITLEDFDEDDLKDIIEYAMNGIANDIIIDNIHSTTNSRPMLSTDDIDSIKEAIIENADKLFELNIPFKACRDYQCTDSPEQVLYTDIMYKIIKQMKSKHVFVWSNNKEDTEFKLDGGDCFKLFEKDNWTILCYANPKFIIYS